MRRFAALVMLLMIGIAALSTLPVTRRAKAYSRAVVYINPMWDAQTATNTVTLTIKISDVTDLYTWDISVRWNKQYLYTERSMVSDMTTEGFMYDWAVAKGYDMPFEIRNVFPLEGYMNLACSFLGFVAGASGSGTLVTITFRVEQGGGVSSGIEMYDIALASSSGYDMPYDVVAIDIFALVKVALAWQTSNPSADVDESGNVDISDLSAVAQNYKKHALVVGKT